jgi:hypothetical protein
MTFDEWLDTTPPMHLHDLAKTMEVALRGIVREAWQAGYEAAHREWRRHCAHGLRENAQETVLQMMQRWQGADHGE